MEKNDLIKEDFLGKLIQNSPLESPSDAFVDDIMSKIRQAPVTIPVRKPFFLFVKNTWIYALLTLAVLIFLLTSDLPFSNVIPGKEYFTNNLLPYISSLFTLVKSSFGNTKAISIPLMIFMAGGLLLLLDHLFSRRTKIQNSMIF